MTIEWSKLGPFVRVQNSVAPPEVRERFTVTLLTGGGCVVADFAMADKRTLPTLALAHRWAEMRASEDAARWRVYLAAGVSVR